MRSFIDPVAIYVAIGIFAVRTVQDLLMVILFVHLVQYFMKTKRSINPFGRKKKLIIISIFSLCLLQVISIGFKMSTPWTVYGACNNDSIGSYRSIMKLVMITTDTLTFYMIMYLFYHISETNVNRKKKRENIKNKQNRVVLP